MIRTAASSITVALFFASTAQAAFVRQPWLQDAKPDQVTVAWEAGAAGGTQTLAYGVAGGPLDQSVAGTLVSDRLYVATVTGLPASSAFDYKVTSGADESPAGSFVTAPAGAEPFRFGVTGDNRSDAAGHANVVAATIPFSPDFMLNTGDIVDGTAYTEFFDIEKDLLKNSVIFPSPGNHDAPTQYVYGFNRPEYYSFRWGNAFFVSVNTDGDYSQGSAQRTWIDQELTAAKADTTIQWIIAFHHHPVYSSGSHGNTQSVIDDLNPLYLANGVDMVFNGHDHNYERIERDNVVYVVAGGGGVSPRDMGAPVTGAIFSESVRHTVIVDIDGGILNLKAYRPDGSLMDEREIVKGPASGGADPEDPTDPEDPSNPADPADPGASGASMNGGCACAIGATEMPAKIGTFLPLVLALAAFARRRRV